GRFHLAGSIWPVPSGRFHLAGSMAQSIEHIIEMEVEEQVSFSDRSELPEVSLKEGRLVLSGDLAHASARVSSVILLPW
ncbi:MAG TPA: hypothetical protein VKV33_00340, partial [Streptosporangiaceae bacterium]|nr:hypothetical protein [Streptosporangiaceae bacterium]